MMETTPEIGIFMLLYKHILIYADVAVRDYWYEIFFSYL